MKKLLFPLAIGACAFLGIAASQAQSQPSPQDEGPDYVRSSLYTILVNSDQQNQRLDDEALYYQVAGVQKLKDGFNAFKSGGVVGGMAQFLPKSASAEMGQYSMPKLTKEEYEASVKAREKAMKDIIKSVKKDKNYTDAQKDSIYTALQQPLPTYEEYEAARKEEEEAQLARLRELRGDGVILAAIPGQEFPNIPIPNQFNDHCLNARIINYDSIMGLVTDADRHKWEDKNSQPNKFRELGAKTVEKATGRKSTIFFMDSINRNLPVVMGRYLSDNHVGPEMVAKWFGYQPDNEQHWDTQFTYVQERGLQNASAADLARAQANSNEWAKIAGRGFDMVDNTYLAGVNLAFRSNQAVVAESQAMAQAAKEASEKAAKVAKKASMFGKIASFVPGIGAAGQIGAAVGSAGDLVNGFASTISDIASMAASDLAGMAAGAAAGEGFRVTSKIYLYKLNWDQKAADRFANEIFYPNATLDQLIDKGIVTLDLVGVDDASALVRQSVLNENPKAELVKRATGRAIDRTIAKLQKNHEEFRPVTPITEIADGGVIYAKIGLKEGIVEGDEYEILEPVEDANGRITYNSKGTVTPDKTHIWNNLYEADVQAAENAQNGNPTAEDAAIEFGSTRFTGASGAQAGYLLRLKNKK